MTGSLFPFAQYWWFYAAFTAGVILLLVIDLGFFHRQAKIITMRSATLGTLAWVSLAALFNIGFYRYCLAKFDPATAKRLALEFMSAYIVEESLSVDNMFVFVLIFSYFAIPRQYQHRVLFFGILGALVFRAMFIALGAAMLQFQWVLFLFGAFLVVTGVRMFFHSSEEIDPDHNPVVKLLRRALPVTSEFHGQHFFKRIAGRLHATPLLVTLAFLEATDIVFAVDSVPAVFGLSREPLVVFTSNIFAILGLRSIFFVLAGAVHKFHLLRYGLALILIFVGLKMTWLQHAWEGHFPISWSLGIIGGLLGVSIAASLLFPQKEEAVEQHATGRGD
jgi:tellurite resistance protein TerC